MGTTPDSRRRRGRTRAARLLVCAASLLAPAVAACSGPAAHPRATSSEPWAAKAEAHIEALHEAYATGFTNVAQFYALDADVDWTGLLGYHDVGRDRFADLLRSGMESEPDPSDRVPVEADEPVYLSRTGALDPMWVQAPGFPHWSQAVSVEVAGTGISREIWSGASHSAGYAGLDPTPVAELVDDHLGGWAEQVPAVVGSRYADDAVLVDSIVGLTLIGREAIAAAATSSLAEGGLPGATLRELPDEGRDGGPAVYLNGTDMESAPDLIDSLSHLALLLSVTDGAGCARDVASLLWLEDGMITREERFHRVDSVRRCVSPDERPGGWWDTVSTPRPDAFTASGRFAIHGVQAALWNSTPQREALLRWALRRFADQGIPLPTVSSVTFAPPVEDPWARHGFLRGAPDLLLPATAPGCPEAGCDQWPTDARAAALDALAHRWLADASRAPLLAAYESAPPEGGTPLPDPARVLAWGLLDAPPEAMDGLAQQCATLAEAFLRLTDRPAPRGPCPDA